MQILFMNMGSSRPIFNEHGTVGFVSGGMENNTSNLHPRRQPDDFINTMVSLILGTFQAPGFSSMVQLTNSILFP